MRFLPGQLIPARPNASWWIVVAAGGLVVVFSVAIVREVLRTRQVRDQVQRLRDQVGAEEQRYAQLEELITYLGSQTFQEREARLKLGLRKPGERVIVVPPGTIPTTNSATGNLAAGGKAQTDPKESNPQRWWRYLFGPRPDPGRSLDS